MQKKGINKHVKKILIATAVMIGALILVAVGYVIYVAASYSRIGDNLPLAVKNNNENIAEIGEEYEILTYNIGFGAYSPEYSFFMDKGEMLDGKKVSGKYGKGISKDDVRRNTVGAAGIICNLNYDFVFVQEIDEDGDRSYHINQVDYIKQQMTGYASTFANNFHSPFLYYPFNDPHGKNNSGLLTLSRFGINTAVRRSLPVATDISKYFDLDRCFSVARISAGSRELVLVNLHLSAYDEGGKIRAEQLKVLCEFLATEGKKGNYVIAGGDFNHDICDDVSFKAEQKKPSWVGKLNGDELPEGFSFARADNADNVPTCRSADMPYEKGVNYTVIVDGFIVSDNIQVKAVYNQDTQFAYSDHNPVYMKFVLEE